MVFGKTITVQSQGFSDIVNISENVDDVVQESKVENGIVCISVIGSTASVATIEYEPALVADMKEQLERMVSQSLRSRHSETWGDDNGFSHLRASLMGPGISLPIVDGALLVGTWQQIVVIDHDNRPRSRKIRIQILGD